jgi:histidinol phosphatase-like PHP family hydrolase
VVTPPVRPTNRDIAELLALEAEHSVGHLQRAFRRASRRAFTWPIEATELLEGARSLQELRGVGPFLAERIERWIGDGVVPGEPPDIRAGFLTLTDARRIIDDRRPLRGDLQMHTTWSDGGSSVERMARAGMDRGYEYIAITDHSAAGLRIVKGLDEARLGAQALEIAQLNGKLEREGAALRVLHSVEMNLDASGAGDLDDVALRKLDIVLGSFHSALRREEPQTERYLAALGNPRLHILGHPRGRIYNFRLGLTADWPAVFAAAAAADKAIEIDSYPDRQDLDVDLLREAAKAGVRISIGTDAHSDSQLEWIDIGLAAAIEAGIDERLILNTMPRSDLIGWASGSNRVERLAQ